MVFALPNDIRERLAKLSDTVTSAWLTRDPGKVVRIFVCSCIGSILINFALNRGYWIEPGSLDEDFV